jgi:hypothetical protein
MREPQVKIQVEILPLTKRSEKREALGKLSFQARMKYLTGRLGDRNVHEIIGHGIDWSVPASV